MAFIIDKNNELTALKSTAPAIPGVWHGFIAIANEVIALNAAGAPAARD